MTRGSTGRLLRGGTAIAVAIGAMNVATYSFTMMAARLLGPQQYGALAGLMATLLVISVIQLGIQATAARRISADPAHVGQIEAGILRVTQRAALVLGVLLLALTPVIDFILRLDNLMAAALIGVAAVPLTLMGGQAGILQGERRWVPLALVYLAAGVPRLLIGLALLAWRPTELTAMLAVVLGQCVPVVVGWYALRSVREAGEVSEAHGARSILREAAHNSQALFAFFALSNVDVIVARNVLEGHEAGLYAGGLILTKAVLFLPQFVVVVAFPSMSSAHERRRALTRSLTAVAVIGAAATVGAMLLSDLAMVFVGGQGYSEIESRLWMFAVLGTALSMLQLLVYSVLARQGQRSVYFVWASLLALVVGGSQMNSLDGLLTVVITVDLSLLAVLIGLSLWLVRDVVAVTPEESAHRR